jgi:transposase
MDSVLKGEKAQNIMARPKGPMRPFKIIKQAYEAYIAGEKVRDIANRFKVSPSTISCWVKKHARHVGDAAYLKVADRRKRRVNKVPSARDNQILACLYSGMPTAKVVEIYDLTRARICFIRKTWTKRGYVPPLLFEIGNIITWKDRFYRILRVKSHTTGDVQQVGALVEGRITDVNNGEVILDFKWYSDKTLSQIIV